MAMTTLRSFMNDMTTGMKDALLWKVQIQPQDAGDHLVEQMYEIDPFETKAMAEWETRPNANPPILLPMKNTTTIFSVMFRVQN
jgi:hypothetical protein